MATPREEVSRALEIGINCFFYLFFFYLKVSKTRLWALPSCLTVVLWTRPACVAEVNVISWANPFLSLLVKSEAVWLRPVKVKFEAKEFFCYTNIDRKIIQSQQMNIYLQISLRFQTNLRPRPVSPLRGSSISLFFSCFMHLLQTERSLEGAHERQLRSYKVPSCPSPSSFSQSEYHD